MREKFTLTREATVDFYLYSGGDDTFRSRALRAQSYFRAIRETGNTDYELYPMAESHFIVGDFYEQYVINATSIKEPTAEAYNSLLTSLNVCLDNIEDYDYDDGAYIKLSMYNEILNLLNDHRKGFAATGVDIDAVLELMQSVYDKTSDLSVTQQMSEDIRNSVLEKYPEYVDAVTRAYTNTQERM